jgi:hypothetical protein
MNQCAFVAHLIHFPSTWLRVLSSSCGQIKYLRQCILVVSFMPFVREGSTIRRIRPPCNHPYTSSFKSQCHPSTSLQSTVDQSPLFSLTRSLGFRNWNEGGPMVLVQPGNRTQPHAFRSRSASLASPWIVNSFRAMLSPGVMTGTGTCTCLSWTPRSRLVGRPFLKRF